jgi:hypothetical protein
MFIARRETCLKRPTAFDGRLARGIKLCHADMPDRLCTAREQFLSRNRNLLGKPRTEWRLFRRVVALARRLPRPSAKSTIQSCDADLRSLHPP